MTRWNANVTVSYWTVALFANIQWILVQFCALLTFAISRILLNNLQPRHFCKLRISLSVVCTRILNSISLSIRFHFSRKYCIVRNFHGAPMRTCVKVSWLKKTRSRLVESGNFSFSAKRFCARMKYVLRRQQTGRLKFRLYQWEHLHVLN